MPSKSVQGLRHFSRVPFDATVRLELQDHGVEVHLIDISLKGALVRTDTPPMLALDEKCRLVLPLANGNESISMGGSVAHLDQQHVGIKCVDIDVVNLTRLRRLIELNTGDADMVDRELSLLLQPR